jgi:Ni,Fe-hydrogenase maturation factor
MPQASPLTPLPVLVLGLGNDILSDDAAGLLVAAAVRERLAGASF